MAHDARMTSRRLCVIRLAVVLLMAMYYPLSAQDDAIARDTTDTVVKVKKSSVFAGKPGKAFLYSMVLPGAGQIYNKSYIRVPFVWGAVGGMGYLVHYNSVRYKCLDAAYKAAVDQVPFVPTKNCPKDMAEDLMLITDPSRLRILRDEANNNRQLSIIGFALVWLANGVDAYVNAHLKEFDVTDDLSVNFTFQSGDDAFAPFRYGVFVNF